MVEVIVGVDNLGRQRASVRYPSFSGDNFACFSFAIAAPGRNLTSCQLQGVFSAALNHTAHDFVTIHLVAQTPSEALRCYQYFRDMMIV